MKKWFKGGFGLVQVIVILAVVALALPALALDDSRDYTYKGKHLYDNGSVIDVNGGTLKISGTAVTATAAQLNAAGSKSGTAVTNVTGLAGFATNIVATEKVYTINYLDTNSSPATLVFTTRTYSVQAPAAPAIQR